MINNIANVQCSENVELHRPYLSHRLHNAVTKHYTDSNIQINKLTVDNIHNIQLIQETQLNQLTHECRHAPKRHDSSVLCPPDPLRTLAVSSSHRQ